MAPDGQRSMEDVMDAWHSLRRPRAGEASSFDPPISLELSAHLLREPISRTVDGVLLWPVLEAQGCLEWVPDRRSSAHVATG